MSAQKQHIDDIPKDAVILSYDEALGHQLQLIRDWDKWSEVWPLRAGVSVLGIAASAAGMYINNHFRRKLKLRNIGFWTTYLPVVVMPGISATLVHKVMVTYPLVMDKSHCPLCIQARAGTMQAAVGFIYPLLLAPMANYMYATRHATYRLPDIVSNFSGVVKQLIRFTKPIGVQLSYIFVGQLLLGSYFTYMEAKSYYTIKKQMLEIEKEYDNSRESSYHDKRD